jgi:hypothetical protein
VHLVAAGEVTVFGTVVVVRDGGTGIRITTAEDVAPTTETWRLDDEELTRVWGERLTRLTYTVPPTAGTLTTIVEPLVVEQPVVEQLRDGPLGAEPRDDGSQGAEQHSGASERVVHDERNSS